MRVQECEGRPDVVICGGGLSGLLLARQLRLELPGVGVTVIERVRRPLPDACHKVGESSVELGSQYLERLGLGDYLRQRHLIKMGLRFFPGAGERPLAERTEIGPCAEPRVLSYQIDRGRFEGDLRGMLEEEGVTLIEGARVKSIELGEGDADHAITYELDGARSTLRTPFVVDATGRAALLRGKLKLKRGAKHLASAGWFRIAGRLDIKDLVPESETGWHSRPLASERWRSTNHLMGDGYWAWLIPLATGYTSVGLVVHEEKHAFERVSSLANVHAFLEEHEPHLARALEQAQVQDFLCLRKYSHAALRCWSGQRWALVGEAGAFVDPLYSPGTDFIAFANSFTTDAIRTHVEGGDLQVRAGFLSSQYRALIEASLNVFRHAAPMYGHAPAMAAKIFWDNFAYWSFTCQYFLQNIWRLSEQEYRPFGQVGRRFVAFTDGMQHLLRAWAELVPAETLPVLRELPSFPSILVDTHVALATKMSTAETLAYMRKRADEGCEIVGELVLRIVQEVGPDVAHELLERAHFADWEVVLTPERLAVEELRGMARRAKTPDLARDVERSLGRAKRHPRADLARQLLIPSSTP